MAEKKPVSLKRSYPNKITAATIGLTSAVLDEVGKSLEGKKAVSIMRIYGRISDTEAGSTAMGDFVKYKGEHEAHNLVDNTLHRSKILIVPEVATTVLDEGLSIAKEKDPEAILEYALDITLVYYKNPNPKGLAYKYGVSPLIEASEDDSISKLGKSLGAAPVLQIAKK